MSTPSRVLLASTLSCVLLASGAWAKKELPTPPEATRVGAAESLVIEPDLTAPGQRQGLWKHQVERKEATFIKLHFAQMNLRPGDTLTLRSRSGQIIETLEGRGPKDQTSFWSLSAFGDLMELEFRYQHAYSELPFSIDRVIAGEHTLFDPRPEPQFPVPESICSPADFEDVICFEDDATKWANVQASVGVMSIGGDPNFAVFCSGSNISPENYVLTNDHCLSTQSDCESTEFVFRYYRTECGNGAPVTEDWVSYRCDEVVAQSPFINCDAGLNDLDFTLSKVQGDPASMFGFADVDPVALTSGEAIYIIQHPSGRPHEITHGAGENVEVDGTVLRYYDTLDTEGGSSGSPVFRESDGKLVGLHHCGGCDDPGVGNRGMMMSDIYPLITDFVCTPALELASAGFEDLEQVSGNDDLFLDPGETWQLRPTLRNRSCSVMAMNASATVGVGPDSVMPVTILDASVEFGNILAGQVSKASSPIQFEVGATADCGGSVVLTLQDIQANNGGPFEADAAMAVLEVGFDLDSTILTQNFARDSFDWTIEDGGTGTGSASTWTRTNPGGRSFAFSEPFVIVDSDALGTNLVMDESLISPLIEVPTFDKVIVQFRHDFRYFSGGLDEQADVDVRSSATGGNWVTVETYTGGNASGTVELDVTEFATNQADFQVRFRYWNAEYEWWWAIDDVFVFGSFGRVCNVAAPTLEVAGSCPGETTLSVSGATPLTRMGFIRGQAGGDFTFEQGLCAGLEIDLANPVAMGSQQTDDSGSASYVLTVPEEACGQSFQAVDTASCRKSEAIGQN